MPKLFLEKVVVEQLVTLVERADGIANFSTEHGVSKESVRLMMHRRRPPTGKVLAACGFRRVIRYEKINEV